ncbi:UNVERIFIED_CONTAM: hypothetical protein RMT77_001611 [Armadillidium vulgare]
MAVYLLMFLVLIVKNILTCETFSYERFPPRPRDYFPLGTLAALGGSAFLLGVAAQKGLNHSRNLNKPPQIYSVDETYPSTFQTPNTGYGQTQNPWHGQNPNPWYGQTTNTGYGQTQNPWYGSPNRPSSWGIPDTHTSYGAGYGSNFNLNPSSVFPPGNYNLRNSNDFSTFNESPYSYVRKRRSLQEKEELFPILSRKIV